MKNTTNAVTLVCAAAITVACGGGGGSAGGADAGPCGEIRVASCTASATEQGCMEVRGAASFSESARAACEAGGDRWAEQPCPRAGSIGGCGTVVECGSQVTWLYEGSSVGTLEDHRRLCSEGGNTFYDP